MIKFNWNTVIYHSKKSIPRILNIVKYITYRRVPYRTKYGAAVIDYGNIKWGGLSYIINPEALFQKLAAKEISQKQTVEYIYLAGRRNYHHYRILKDKALSTKECSQQELNVAKTNPLLRIEDERIIFELE